MKKRTEAKDDDQSNKSVSPPTSDDEAEVLIYFVFFSYFTISDVF